jgi:lipoprotein NlpI
MKKTASAALLLAATVTPGFCTSFDELNAAISYFNQEQYDNAITWFDKAIAAGDLIPDLMHVAYVDRGMAYAAKGETQKALSDYSAAIAARPDDVLAYYLRIRIYASLNDDEKTLADYRQLMKLRPHEYSYRMNVGWLSWQLNDVAASASAFEPYSRRTLDAWLWLQLANVRQGKPVDDYKEESYVKSWPAHVARFYRGTISESDVLAAASAAQKEKSAGSQSKRANCDAYFYTGMWRVVHGDQAGAAPLLQNAVDSCEGLVNRRFARAELAKMTSGEKAK